MFAFTHNTITYIHNIYTLLYDVGVAVVAQRDTATSLTRGLKLHTTDLVILTPGQELGLYIRI